MLPRLISFVSYTCKKQRGALALSCWTGPLWLTAHAGASQGYEGYSSPFWFTLLGKVLNQPGAQGKAFALRGKVFPLVRLPADFDGNQVCQPAKDKS